MAFIFSPWTIIAIVMLVLVARPTQRRQVLGWLVYLYHHAVRQVRVDTEPPTWNLALREAIFDSMVALEGIIVVCLDWVVDLPPKVYVLVQNPETRELIMGSLTDAVNREGRLQAMRQRSKWTPLEPSSFNVHLMSTGASATTVVRADQPAEQPISEHGVEQPVTETDALTSTPSTRPPAVTSTRRPSSVPPTRDRTQVSTREMSVMADLLVADRQVATACVMRGKRIKVGRGADADLRIPAELDLTSIDHGDIAGGMRGRAMFYDHSSNGSWASNPQSSEPEDRLANKVAAEQRITPGTVLHLGACDSEVRIEFR